MDRFIGLVAHVVDQVGLNRSIAMDAAMRDGLVSDVFYAWIKDDFAVLRRFRQESSLATYLTVVARRIVIRTLAKQRSERLGDGTQSIKDPAALAAAIGDSNQLANREVIDEALSHLSSNEAVAVRMFHLEGKSYREISSHIGMTENSVGPFLTKAREKLRRDKTLGDAR